MVPLDQFPDNDEIIYRVDRDGVYWAFRRGDVTRPIANKEQVTKRMVRQMFIRFIQASPDLQGKSRDEQIRQFNLERRSANLPKIDSDILADVLITIDDEPPQRE